MDEQDLGFVRDPSEQAAETVSAADGEGFNGTYHHGLDSKNRVIIPAKLRGGLGPNFVLCPSFDFSAVAIYPRDKWIEYRDGLRKLARFNSKLQKYLETFNAMSFRDQAFDFQGRVVLPTILINRLLKKSPADDIRELELQGCEDYIRIVAKASEEESFAAFMADIGDTMREFNELGRAQLSES